MPNSFTKPEDLIAELVSKYKTEDTVFIIGGGPSVKDIIPDPSVLFNHDVICCNDAYQLFPDAILTHFADKAWWEWHDTHDKHDIRNTFRGHITTVANGKSSKFKNDDRVTVFSGNSPEARRGYLSNEKQYLTGNNTGHQAINIAVHMGYKQIVLIGFDMIPCKKTHWHTNHERRVSIDNFTNTIIPGFATITPGLQKEFDITIYNLFHDSGIRNFQFANLEDFI